MENLDKWPIQNEEKIFEQYPQNILLFCTTDLYEDRNRGRLLYLIPITFTFILDTYNTTDLLKTLRLVKTVDKGTE